ncbi:hypothetical protein BH11PAT2_BH11PAT2_06620 [soil metagenome]
MKKWLVLLSRYEKINGLSIDTFHLIYPMIFRTRTLIIAAVIVAVISGLMYSYLYVRDGRVDDTMTVAPVGATMGKVAASQAPDGTYTVTIRSVLSTPEDTVLTLTPVTVSGTTTQETGAPDFRAPVNANTKVTLVDNANATTKDLGSLARTTPPVFEVTIEGGNITMVTEKESVSAVKK